MTGSTIAPHDTDNVRDDTWHDTPGGHLLHVNGYRGFVSDPNATGWHRGIINAPNASEPPILDHRLGKNLATAQRTVEGLLALATGIEGDKQLGWRPAPAATAMAERAARTVEEYVGPHGYSARIRTGSPFGRVFAVSVFHGGRRVDTTTDGFPGHSPHAVTNARQWALDTIRTHIIAAARIPDFYSSFPACLPDAEDLDTRIAAIIRQQEATRHDLEHVAVTRIARYFHDHYPAAAVIELDWNDDSLAVVGAYDHQGGELTLGQNATVECPWAAHLSPISPWLDNSGEFHLLDLAQIPGFRAADQT